MLFKSSGLIRDALLSVPIGTNFVFVPSNLRPEDVERLQRCVTQFVAGQAGVESHGDWDSIWSALQGRAGDGRQSESVRALERRLPGPVSE